MKFRFISDAGHGWLEVPRDLVESQGLSDQISQYSYQRGDWAYLEEDCDAYLMIKSLQKAGAEFQIEEVYQDPTPIRRYARFSA